jgi:hypothetical protein
MFYAITFLLMEVFGASDAAALSIALGSVTPIK